MIDAGLPIAFASDYNPGSSPSGNMNFMISLGCIDYKLNPEEVINAATIIETARRAVTEKQRIAARHKRYDFAALGRVQKVVRNVRRKNAEAAAKACDRAQIREFSACA